MCTQCQIDEAVFNTEQIVWMLDHPVFPTDPDAK